jgi:hypothetical protein
MSKHVTVSPEELRIDSQSANSSRPMRTAPIVAPHEVRCLSLPQTRISLRI